MVKLIFIEGNVASGKTSALRYLETTLGEQITLLEEPVTDWQQVKDKEAQQYNLLNQFYQDFAKYGFCFQTYTFLSRMNRLLETMKNNDKEVIVCERSIFTDREIFLEMLYQNGSLTQVERAVYHNLWDFWISLMKPYFKGVTVEFLYICCTPEKALEHLKIRARKEEDQVGLDYLTGLENNHRKLYYSNDHQRLSELVSTLTDNHQELSVKVLENNNDREDYLLKLDAWISQLFD